MDNRFFLWAAVGLLWLMVWQTWQQDYARRQPPVETPATDVAAPGDIPASDLAEMAAPPSDLPVLPDASAGPARPSADAPAASGAPTVRVTTDVYDLLIDTAGARLRDVTLKKYPIRKDEPDVLVSLLTDDPAELLLLQTGLLGAGEHQAPNHETVYQAARTSYALADGADRLDVPVTWQSDDGVTVTKTFHFYRGRYNVDVDVELDNGGSESWAGAHYFQLRRTQVKKKRSFVDVDSYSFVGPVFYDGQATRKYKPKDFSKRPIEGTISGAWVASIQHHFLSAIIPNPADPYVYSSRVLDGPTELISGVGARADVAPGASTSFSHSMFVGPKYQAQLTATAPGLVRTVDYGILSVISQPLFWLLQKIHGLVGNWGWAIILMTIIIKLLFYPLAEKSGRSMAKMRALAPRMKTLQERYKDDRQALSKAMMDMYKREKVNPMSSCLPLLLQMPVFLALYWVLLESVELRQAPWIGWINDLSSRDPFFVLPLIMAVAMFVQTKLNPPPADPTTARVMTIMPIMMSVFFAFFPAGLVLYWVVNTVLSVAQQWRINRVVEKAASAH